MKLILILSHLVHRKPARIYLKANTPKTTLFVADFGQFFSKMSKERPVQSMTKDIGNIWFQQDGVTYHTAESTSDALHPVVEDRIISCRADVVCPSRSCDLTPLDYYLWGAFNDKCYGDKPETIEVLKDNIREVFSKKKVFGGPCI